MYCKFLISALLVLFSGNALAEADGPDYYRLRDVSSDDTLNIRAEPDPTATRLGEMPSGADCIRNLGCQGGLSFQEFTTLSKVQQEKRLKQIHVGAKWSIGASSVGWPGAIWQRAVVRQISGVSR